MKPTFAHANFPAAISISLILAFPLSLYAPPVIGLQGTNAPGSGTNFTFTIPTSRASLSIFFAAQTNAGYSHLYLKKDGTPTESDFDFVSRSDVFTNRICIETPEFDPVVTNYGLRVFTPASSTTHSFMVAIALNATDRSVSRPALKPASFTTTGVLTNSASKPLAQWQVFQVDVPSALANWTITVQSTNALIPNLYVRKELQPDTNAWLRASLSDESRQIVFTNREVASGTWFVGVHLPTAETSTAYSITATATWPEVPLRFETTAGALALSNGVLHMRAIGGTNAVVVLEQSSTLSNWMPCLTNTLTNGVWNISMPLVPNSQQFFRLEGQ